MNSFGIVIHYSDSLNILLYRTIADQANQYLEQFAKDGNIYFSLITFLLPANVVCEGYVFTPVCDSVNGGGACCARGGACMVKGGVHNEVGCPWWRGVCVVKGACVAKGACVVTGGMHIEGGHVWWRGACMVCTAPLYEIWPVNVEAVRILLECILVKHYAIPESRHRQKRIINRR